MPGYDTISTSFVYSQWCQPFYESFDSDGWAFIKNKNDRSHQIFLKLLNEFELIFHQLYEINQLQWKQSNELNDHIAVLKATSFLRFKGSA